MTANRVRFPVPKGKAAYLEIRVFDSTGDLYHSEDDIPIAGLIQNGVINLDVALFPDRNINILSNPVVKELNFDVELTPTAYKYFSRADVGSIKGELLCALPSGVTSEFPLLFDMTLNSENQKLVTIAQTIGTFFLNVPCSLEITSLESGLLQLQSIISFTLNETPSQMAGPFEFSIAADGLEAEINFATDPSKLHIQFEFLNLDNSLLNMLRRNAVLNYVIVATNWKGESTRVPLIRNNDSLLGEDGLDTSEGKTKLVLEIYKDNSSIAWITSEQEIELNVGQNYLQAFPVLFTKELSVLPSSVKTMVTLAVNDGLGNAIKLPFSKLYKSLL